MADLTKCSGENCPIKDTCHRFTVPADPDRQSFFSEVPGFMEDGEFICQFFWGKSHQSYYDQIQKIVKGETMDKS